MLLNEGWRGQLISLSWSCVSSASGTESVLFGKDETLWEQQGSLGNATSSVLLSSKGQERLIKKRKAGPGSGPSASNSTTRLHYFTSHSAALDLFSMKSTKTQLTPLFFNRLDLQLRNSFST